MRITIKITDRALLKVLKNSELPNQLLQKALKKGLNITSSDKPQTASAVKDYSHSEFMELIAIKKTKDKPRKSWYRTKGKKTQMGIMAFWRYLFEANEILDTENKMTNAEIERQVRLEFPHEDRLIRNLDSGKQSVNYYRHLYNKGRMDNGVCPKHISFRYDYDGRIVNTRTGIQLLTRADIQRYIEKYKN